MALIRDVNKTCHFILQTKKVETERDTPNKEKCTLR